MEKKDVLLFKKTLKCSFKNKSKQKFFIYLHCTLFSFSIENNNSCSIIKAVHHLRKNVELEAHQLLRPANQHTYLDLFHWHQNILLIELLLILNLLMDMLKECQWQLKIEKLLERQVWIKEVQKRTTVIGVKKLGIKIGSIELSRKQQRYQNRINKVDLQTLLHNASINLVCFTMIKITKKQLYVSYI